MQTNELEKEVHQLLNRIYPDRVEGLWDSPELITHHITRTGVFDGNTPTELRSYVESWQTKIKKRHLH